MERRIFIIFLFFFFIVLIPKSVVFAAAEDEIKLEKGEIEKIFQSLKQPLENEWISSEGEASGAITVMKQAIKLEIGEYLLFEVPKDMVKNVLTITINLARVLLGDETAIANVLDEVEKKTVEAAKEYAMEWLLQNEIKVGNGNLGLNYPGIDNKWHNAVFSYMIVQKPINLENSELAIEFLSPDIIKAPALIAGYQWEGGINEIPPFILRVKGTVEKSARTYYSYRWTEGPEIEVIFNEPVPKIEIEEKGLLEGWVDKITSYAEKAREVIDIFGDIFKRTGGFLSDINPFVAKVGPEVSYFNDFEETFEEFQETEQEIEKEILEEIEEKNREPLPVGRQGLSSESLDLEKMQDMIDDIAEQIDILSQKLAELKPRGESTPLSVPAPTPDFTAEDEEEEIQTAFFKPPTSTNSAKRVGVGGSGGGGSSSEPEISWCEVSAVATRDKVIFSEIAWMGDLESSSNEWIKLKNISGSSINLENWQIFDKAKQIKIVFDSGGVIESAGFYLLQRSKDYTGALNDTDEALYLFSSNCVLQDFVEANPNWPAGDKDNKETMKRNNDFTWYDYPDSIIDVESSTGEVVINEVAWMGTKSSANDEWIELYNPGTESIDLYGWQLILTPLVGDPKIIMLDIDSPSVKAQSYFLLERTDDTTISDTTADYIYTGALNDECNSLELKDSNGNLIDKINCVENNWPAGTKEARVSMERAIAGSWYSNNLITRNGQDAEGNRIWGTPKAQNSISVSPTEIIEQLPFDEFSEITLPLVSSPYIIKINLSVPENKILLIEAGVVNKFYNTATGMTILGTLKADNSVFTSFNNAPSYGDWGRLYFGPASINSELKNISLRYGGGDPAGTPCSDNMAGIQIENSSVLIESSIIEKNKGRGITLIDSSSVINNSQIIDNPPCFGDPYEYGGFGIWIRGGNPTVTNSLIKQNNAGIFIDGYASSTIENNVFEENKKPVWLYRGLPSFSGNQANNNEMNAIYVYGDVSQDATWKQDLPYVISGSLPVSESITLTLEPGVMVDFYDNYSGLSISGTLKANNVEFSSYNKETPKPGSWSKITFRPESINSELDNVNLNYGGGGFGTPCSTDMTSVLVDQSSISLKNSLINNSQYSGIYLINSNSILDNITINNTVSCKSDPYTYGGFGINIEGGSPSLENLSFNNNENCNILLNGECYPQLPPILPTETPFGNP